MQYLLTKEELDALVPKAELERKVKAIDKMWEVMAKAGLLHCTNEKGERHRSYYCDDCPLAMSSVRWNEEYHWMEDACTKPHEHSQ